MKPILNIIFFVIVYVSLSLNIYGGGINTNAALLPAKGEVVTRTQFKRISLSSNSKEVDLNLLSFTFVYGLTGKSSFLSTIKYFDRDIQTAAGLKISDEGLGDFSLIYKFQFYQRDQKGETTRFAFVSGIEVPSDDKNFSSKSYDPIAGIVWTHQEAAWSLDWDMSYKLNTDDGIHDNDHWRSNIALTKKFFDGQTNALGPWLFNGIAEINSNGLTNGTLQIFLAPGLQFVSYRWIIEMSLQMPLVQDVKRGELENDSTATLSFRISF